MPLLFATLFIFSGGPSFGLYDISKSLTIPGWIVLSILSFLIIAGIITILKLFKKFRGKLK